MRIRSTKPEFWRSRTVALVSWDARLVLKGLESYVDDNGVGKDDLALIVGDVFPRDLVANPRDTLARVSEAISELHEVGLIWRYEADGRPLVYISNWEDIQRIDKPGKGRLPRPDGTLDYKASVIRESVASPRESVAPGTGEQGNRGTGEQGQKSAPVSTSPDDAREFGHELETVSPETVFPRGWAPANRHKAYALEHNLDLAHEARMFAEHARANGRTAVDWDAAFMTWLGKARPRGRPGDATGTTRARQTLALAAQYEAQEGADRDQITDRPAAR